MNEVDIWKDLEALELLISKTSDKDEKQRLQDKYDELFDFFNKTYIEKD